MAGCYDKLSRLANRSGGLAFWRGESVLDRADPEYAEQVVPSTDGEGQATTVTGSMSQTALHIGTMQLASSKGSRCADPGLREWQGDDGVIYDFNWSS